MIGFRLERTIVLGIRSLALHKLRSILTALGIIFGVSSVIAMLSIGEGAHFEAQEEIKKLGSRNVILKSVKPAEEQSSGYVRSPMMVYGLTWRDFGSIRDTVRTVETLVPIRIIPSGARYRRNSMDLAIVGTTPEYLEVGNVELARGSFLSPHDTDTSRPAAVLGSDVAAELSTEDPLGKRVKLGTHYFRVVGILAETGVASGTGGIEADDRNRNVYVPLTTAQSRYGETLVREVSGSRIMERVELHQIIIALTSEDLVVVTADALRGLLAKFHKLSDYEVMVPLELLHQKQRTKRIFNVVLGSIAAISLLVGGIGIMNIMLASITERTREIGIRRALGAKRRDIVTQFLVETVVLSMTGGIFGIFLGIGIPYVVEATSDMQTIVPAYALFLSFGISAGVGVIFGLYPASRAASMDPIEALRRE